MKESRNKTQQEIRSQRRQGIGLLVVELQAQGFNAAALHAPGRRTEL